MAANTDLLPDVRVEEITVAPSAPLVEVSLTPTLVGPCYRVVRGNTIVPQGAFNGSIPEVTYPILDPGAIVDYSSVALTVVNAVVQVFTRPGV